MSSTGNAAVRAAASKVRWLFSARGSLSENALRGGFWLVAGDLLVRFSGMLKLACIGRVLGPADFGTMGIAMVMLQCIGYFTQTGLDAAMIQKRGDIRPYLDSVWTIQLSRSAFIALLAYLAAPFGAWFFHHAEAAGIIRAMGVAVLVYGAANPATVYFRRELAFRQQVAMNLAGAAVGLVTAVVLAWIYRNVWALVISVIASRATETVMSYYLRPYCPRFHIDRRLSREMMRFGRWVFGNNIVSFALLYLDSILVGRFLGHSALGVYQMGTQLSLTPLTQAGGHVYGVLFPALSRIDDSGRERRAFVAAVRFLAAAVVPAALCATLFGPVLIRMFLGSKWSAVAPVLGWLAWAGAARALWGVASSVFLSRGKPHLSFLTGVGTVPLLIALVFPLMLWYGLPGAAAGVAISSVVRMVFLFAISTRLVKITAGELLRALGGCLPGCGCFLAAGLFRTAGPPGLEPLWVVLGSAGYVTALVMGLRSLRRERTTA